MTARTPDAWPALPPLEQWQETFETLHRWSQIIGKVRLAHSPWTNHSWHVPLYLTTHGLTTSPIYHGRRAFEIHMDLQEHCLRITTAEGPKRSFDLKDTSVADFYRKTMGALADLGIETKIWTVPVEIPGEVERFPDDTRAGYDAEVVAALWQALLDIQRVLMQFRARFIGKVSPVHFFWGAFDLAVTRFSGRTAPEHPGGAPNCPDWVMREAYSHEVSSAGFWSGAGYGEPAFYSYAYPGPDGFADASVRPEAAHWFADLGEFVLPYEAVRKASDPDAALMEFLQSTYDAAADLAQWDRAALERDSFGPDEP
jgi:hypothetical protein